MPEAVELKLTADFINKSSKNIRVVKIEKSEISKGIEVDLYEKVYLEATSRGKELRICMHSSHNGHYLFMTMGMSGYFELTDPDNIHKHAHLRFFLENGNVLSFVDPRRFGRWRFGSDWTGYRGPCILQDSLKFQLQASEALTDPRLRTVRIADLLMNQTLFSGVGNYLRAEIIEQSGLNPFRQLETLASTELLHLAKTCTNVAEQSMKLGGGQLKDWKNPFGQAYDEFRSWLQVYGKAERVRDLSGRVFWFNAKWKETKEYEKYIEAF